MQTEYDYDYINQEERSLLSCPSRNKRRRIDNIIREFDNNDQYDNHYECQQQINNLLIKINKLLARIELLERITGIHKIDESDEQMLYM